MKSSLIVASTSKMRNGKRFEILGASKQAALKSRSTALHFLLQLRLDDLDTLGQGVVLLVAQHQHGRPVRIHHRIE